MLCMKIHSGEPCCASHAIRGAHRQESLLLLRTSSFHRWAASQTPRQAPQISCTPPPRLARKGQCDLQADRPSKSCIEHLPCTVAVHCRQQCSLRRAACKRRKEEGCPAPPTKAARFAVPVVVSLELWVALCAPIVGAAAGQSAGWAAAQAGIVAYLGRSSWQLPLFSGQGSLSQLIAAVLPCPQDMTQPNN
jgi:hypothetical protein